MRKSKTESQQTRRHLLDAALEVFYREGVAGATLQQIAELAGVTRGALYWHFRNKEDLFEALFEDCFGDIIGCLDNTGSGSDPWQRVQDSLLAVFRLIEHNERHYKFYTVVHFKCERTERTRTLTRLTEKYHNLCRERIRALLPENSSDAALLYLEAAVVGLIQIWAAQPQRFSLSETAAQHLHFAAALLQADKK